MRNLHYLPVVCYKDFPGGSDGKASCLHCGRPGLGPWVGKILWRRKWQATPVLLPGESHGRRRLVGYTPRGRKESDTTEWLHSLSFYTVNFQMFKLVLEKAEEPEIKFPTSTGSSKKQERSRKTSISALLTMPKPLTVWITINCGKFWKRWEYQTIWPASWEICM